MLQSYALPILVPNGRPADRAATCTRHRDAFAYCRPTRIRPQNTLGNVSQQPPAESDSLPKASAPDIAPKSVPILEKVRREQVSGLFMLVMFENSGEPVPDTKPECRTIRSTYKNRLLSLTAATHD